MPQFVALLRGINVGGKNVIKMQALRESLTGGGLKEVQTYIQSGNIVFEFKKATTTSLQKKIRGLILDDFGCDVPVMVLESNRFLAVSKKHPFEPKAAEHKLLHVTLLDGKPKKSQLSQLAQKAAAWNDEYKVKEQAVFLFAPGGYHKTKLSNDLFEKALEMKATTRNWRTMQKIREMLLA